MHTARKSAGRHHKPDYTPRHHKVRIRARWIALLLGLAGVVAGVLVVAVGTYRVDAVPAYPAQCGDVGLALPRRPRRAGVRGARRDRPPVQQGRTRADLRSDRRRRPGTPTAAHPRTGVHPRQRRPRVP